MKGKARLLTFLAVFLAVFGVGRVQAATILGDYLNEKGLEVEVSAGLDFYDKYIWRGFRLDGDASLQPSVTIAVGGLEFGFWGSWDLESNDGLASDEVDGWIGYNFDLGFLDEDLEMVGISFGHTWYGFPEVSTYSKEFYLGVSLDTFLSPYVTWYNDYVDEVHGGADGNYVMMGIGHSLTLVEEYGITLDLGFELGLNNEAFIVGEGGYTLYSVGVPLPLTDNLTITPTMAYSVPFGDLEKGSDGSQKDEFYGGVSMAMSL